MAPKLDNYDDINQVFQESAPEGYTPTGESLSLVLDILSEDPSEYEKIVVLATDGEPNTCAQLQPWDSPVGV